MSDNDNTNSRSLTPKSFYFVTEPKAAGTAVFPARIVSSVGWAIYSVREQTVSSTGIWSDKSGVANISAINMSEMSIGPGAAVDVGQKVLVLTCTSTDSPGIVRYYFDHPVYAKYLS